jgi:hypothetical protein
VRLLASRTGRALLTRFFFISVSGTVTNLKVAGSRPDEVNDFLSSYLILPVALDPGVYSASNRNEYQKHKNNVSGE